jgi:hypothetical protein
VIDSLVAGVTFASMRRSAAAAILALALLAVTTSVAAAGGGGVTVKIPTPAIGKGSAESVKIHVSGPKAGAPTLAVSNLAALGKGFGGAVVVTHVGGGSYVAFMVLFMGNLSKSPASTINLQVTPPAGDTASVSKPTNQTQNCSAIKKLGKDTKDGKVLVNNGDKFSIFWSSMSGFLCP